MLQNIAIYADAQRSNDYTGMQRWQARPVHAFFGWLPNFRFIYCVTLNFEKIASICEVWIIDIIDAL